MSFEELEVRYPDLPGTIVEAYDCAAIDTAHVEAIIEGQERVTYAELKQRSEAIACALVNAGIKPGDHVGICVGNGPSWCELFCGILRAGAVCVPINTRLKAREIAYQLKQADVKLLITVDTLLNIDFIAILREICTGVDRSLPDPALPDLRQIVVLSDQVPAACQAFDAFLAGGKTSELPTVPMPGDAALIQFTSGTTSLPKGVLLSHRSMVTDAYFVGKRIGMRPGDRYLSARPFFHVAGSTLSVVVSAVHAITLVTMKRFVAEDALRLLAEENCTLTSGNDTMYLMMLSSPDFSKYSYKLRGGWAAASPSIMRRIAEQFGATETVGAYGLSEASPNISMSDHERNLEDRVEGWMTPHPGLQLKIVDPETGVERPRGAEGEIRVQGWCVMSGYYRQPEATADTMTEDGYLKSGDIGVMRENGDIRFVGRLKEIIRVGGENVAPSDIENTINLHPAVRQAVAFALPDPRLVEVPGVYVVLRSGQSLTEQELLEWTKPRLAGFKLPKHLAIVDSFEAIGMTASAKVQKKHLAEHAVRLFGLEDVA